jgi:hypothetical protein
VRSLLVKLVCAAIVHRHRHPFPEGSCNVPRIVGTADDIMDTENNCTMNAILLKQPFVIGTYSLYRFPGQWLTNQTTMR